MNWFKLLQQAIDYIEAHLLEKITYEDVAKEVHMSSYNFHRTFSLMAGMTANTYIRNRRLSMAGHELQTTPQKVIDLSYKYGYDTPESFTKAFTRFHGVSPKSAKLSGTQLLLFNPLIIKLSLEGGTAMNYKIEHTEKKHFITQVRAFKNETMNDEKNLEIPNFWSELYTDKRIDQLKALRPAGKKDLYGLCSPTKNNDLTFDYGIGVLIDEQSPSFNPHDLLDQGFQFWDIDAGTYAVFNCYGTNGDCISDMWSQFLKEFSPQTGYEQTDQTDFEIYFESAADNLFCELWIPVKKNTLIAIKHLKSTS